MLILFFNKRIMTSQLTLINCLNYYTDYYNFVFILILILSSFN